MLECLEEDEATTSQDIFIELPDVHELTDEDSGDEEQPHIDNLTGNQLRAYAHISNNEDQVSENVSVRREVSGRSAKKETYTWKKKTNVSNAAVVFPETNHDRYKNLSPIELFELFFDDQLITLIVQESKSYCLSKNWPNLQLNKEVKVILGILIVSGYIYHSSRNDYWSNGDDFRNLAVYESMRRERFEQIMRCLHFRSNDNLDINDKYCKLRPLIRHLQK